MSSSLPVGSVVHLRLCPYFGPLGGWSGLFVLSHVCLVSFVFLSHVFFLHTHIHTHSFFSIHLMSHILVIVDSFFRALCHCRMPYSCLRQISRDPSGVFQFDCIWVSHWHHLDGRWGCDSWHFLWQLFMYDIKCDDVMICNIKKRLLLWYNHDYLLRRRLTVHKRPVSSVRQTVRVTVTRNTFPCTWQLLVIYNACVLTLDYKTCYLLDTNR